jgi:flagellar basal body P-ring formation protein FlgA
MNLPSNLKKISSKQWRTILPLFFFILLPVLPAQSKSYENLAELRKKVEQYLLNQFQSPENERLEIKMGFWDRRLLIAACQQDIAFKLQDTAAPGGSLTVNCRCPDSPGWSVNLSAQVDIYKPVAVAKENIPRGSLITANVLAYETRNISQLGEQSFTDITPAMGKAAKRLITKGDVIRPSLLDQPRQVTRGEMVSITATTGSIRVVMQGTALSDGKLGQRIRVKNSQSERIISAKVVGPAEVEIL